MQTNPDNQPSGGDGFDWMTHDGSDKTNGREGDTSRKNEPGSSGAGQRGGSGSGMGDGSSGVPGNHNITDEIIPGGSSSPSGSGAAGNDKYIQLIFTRKSSDGTPLSGKNLNDAIVNGIKHDGGIYAYIQEGHRIIRIAFEEANTTFKQSGSGADSVVYRLGKYQTSIPVEGIKSVGFDLNGDINSSGVVLFARDYDSTSGTWKYYRITSDKDKIDFSRDIITVTCDDAGNTPGFASSLPNVWPMFAILDFHGVDEYQIGNQLTTSANNSVEKYGNRGSNGIAPIMAWSTTQNLNISAFRNGTAIDPYNIRYSYLNIEAFYKAGGALSEITAKNGEPLAEFGGKAAGADITRISPFAVTQGTSDYNGLKISRLSRISVNTPEALNAWEAEPRREGHGLNASEYTRAVNYFDVLKDRDSSSLGASSVYSNKGMGFKAGPDLSMSYVYGGRALTQVIKGSMNNAGSYYTAPINYRYSGFPSSFTPEPHQAILAIALYTGRSTSSDGSNVAAKPIYFSTCSSRKNSGSAKQYQDGSRNVIDSNYIKLPPTGTPKVINAKFVGNATEFVFDKVPEIDTTYNAADIFIGRYVKVNLDGNLDISADYVSNTMVIKLPGSNGKLEIVDDAIDNTPTSLYLRASNDSTRDNNTKQSNILQVAGSTECELTVDGNVIAPIDAHANKWFIPEGVLEVTLGKVGAKRTSNDLYVAAPAGAVVSVQATYNNHTETGTGISKPMVFNGVAANYAVIKDLFTFTVGPGGVPATSIASAQVKVTGVSGPACLEVKPVTLSSNLSNIPLAAKEGDKKPVSLSIDALSFRFNEVGCRTWTFDNNLQVVTNGNVKVGSGSILVNNNDSSKVYNLNISGDSINSANVRIPSLAKSMDIISYITTADKTIDKAASLPTTPPLLQFAASDAPKEYKDYKVSVRLGEWLRSEANISGKITLVYPGESGNVILPVKIYNNETLQPNRTTDFTIRTYDQAPVKVKYDFIVTGDAKDDIVITGGVSIKGTSNVVKASMNAANKWDATTDVTITDDMGIGVIFGNSKDDIPAKLLFAIFDTDIKAFARWNKTKTNWKKITVETINSTNYTVSDAYDFKEVTLPTETNIWPIVTLNHGWFGGIGMVAKGGLMGQPISRLEVGTLGRESSTSRVVTYKPSELKCLVLNGQPDVKVDTNLRALDNEITSISGLKTLDSMVLKPGGTYVIIIPAGKRYPIADPESMDIAELYNAYSGPLIGYVPDLNNDNEFNAPKFDLENFDWGSLYDYYQTSGKKMDASLSNLDTSAAINIIRDTCSTSHAAYQSGNQYIYFRRMNPYNNELLGQMTTRDVNSKEIKYVFNIFEQSAIFNLLSGSEYNLHNAHDGVKTGDDFHTLVDIEDYIATATQNKEGLMFAGPYLNMINGIHLNSDNTNSHITLGPGESVDIPVVILYKTTESAPELSFNMGFDIRNSLYSDPLYYQITFNARHSQNASDMIGSLQYKTGTRYNVTNV